MSKAVDEEKVLVEGVLDVLDVVLGAHVAMEVRVLAPVDPFNNFAVVPKMYVETLRVGRRAQQQSRSKVIVRGVVDEERCLAEVVLDAVDVVLCALVTMSLPWQSELQVPSVVCVMPPPTS